MASKKTARAGRADRLNVELKWAIFKSGHTQRALARRLKMDETRLSRLVRGQAQPFPHERKLLSDALHKEESDLFRPRSKVA